MVTRLESLSTKELATFVTMWKAINRLTMLIYHNPDKVLWIDLDALKEFGFGAVAFHDTKKSALPKGQWPSRISIQLILFFSRLLTHAK